MSGARLLISLLPAGSSDQLLRAVHHLLPPQRSSSVGLLLAPEPAMGVASVRSGGNDLMILMAAGQALPDAEGVAAPCLVWCRDEVEAASVDPRVGVPVVAETLEQLAWELVRRLAGDLSPAAVETLELAHRSESAVDAAEIGPPAAEPLPVTPRRRAGGLPAPPPWALGGSPEQRVHPSSRPLSNQPMAARWSDPPGEDAGPPLRSVAAPSAELLALVPPPVTPLAALAQIPAADATRSAAVETIRETPSSTTRTPRAGQGRAFGRVRELVGRSALRTTDPLDSELSTLGQGLVRAHSILVVVGTPKGGPGKTTDAAAIAILGARAVEPHGGSAVLVDANLNNPDSWRQLAVPTDAITVREVVDALSSGALPPNGEFAREARLRVLPERRSAGSAYSAAEISRLARHLRLRHTLIVVDLPNSLPSLSEGPKEAVVAHWLGHADVVVLPLDLGEASFIAAGEMLDAIESMVAGSRGGVRMPGLVVPLLLPSDGRRAAQLPQIAALLDHLRAAGGDVVEVPHTVDVQTASHRRHSIVGASARADRAFLGVLRAVIDARHTEWDGSHA